MKPRSARARAGINLALVKYWGKRDSRLNLPAAGSLSVTLSRTGSTTSVRFDPSLSEDRFLLQGRYVGGVGLSRVCALLDLVRELAGIAERAEVTSVNDVPANSGLATSASGFAALTLAATRAAGLDLSPQALASLARRGSGSAARSLFPGFVEVLPGQAQDGSDYAVRSVAPPDHMDLTIVLAITACGPKTVGSREGMERTRVTSPYYQAWLETVAQDLDKAKDALERRDFSALGRVAQAQAFRMHAVAMASDPPLLYWEDGTIRLLRAVWTLHEQGIECYPSVDAGPHVFVLCRSKDAETVAAALGQVHGVRKVLVDRPGPGAEAVL